MATTNKAFRVKTGLIVEGAELKPAAGTTSYPPILLTSGTNLTTATAGAFEYDGTNFYLTPTAGNRKTIAFTDLAVSQATSSVLGTIKLSSDTAQTVAINAVSATASRSYGLQVNASGQGIVNVPWTDTVYTLPAATDTVRGGIELFNATAQSIAANAVTTTASRTYGLQVNAEGQGVINVPWTDTDTNWYPTTFTYTNGTTAGPTGSLSGTGMSAVSFGAIPSASGSVSGIVTTDTQTFAGVKTFSSFPEVSGTPSGTNQLVNKAYVDNLSTGIDWKASVRAATTVASPISSSYANGSVIDGVTLVTGDRILIKNQGTGSENGIYTVNATGAPTRATDADLNTEVSSNLAVFVEEGTANADSGWVLTNNGAITIGTTALTFTQFTGIGSFTAGDGLTKTGSTLSVNLDSSPSGLKFNSAKLAVDPSQLYIGTSQVVLANSTPISQALTGILSITGTVANMQINPANRATGSGYSMTIQGGLSDANAGGTASLLGGYGVAAGAAGGAVYITGGNGNGAGVGGDIYIDGGNSGGSKGKINLGTSSAEIDIGQSGASASTTRILGNVQINSIAGLVTASGSTTGVTALTLSSIYDRTVYNGGEFIIKATNGSNIEITKVLVITNGTDVYMTTYGDVFVTADLVSINFTYSTNNVNMVVTPVAGTTGTTTVRVTGTLLAV